MKDLKTKKNIRGGGKSSELRKVKRQIRLLKGGSQPQNKSLNALNNVQVGGHLGGDTSSADEYFEPEVEVQSGEHLSGDTSSADEYFEPEVEVQAEIQRSKSTSKKKSTSKPRSKSSPPLSRRKSTSRKSTSRKSTSGKPEKSRKSSKSRRPRSKSSPLLSRRKSNLSEEVHQIDVPNRVSYKSKSTSHSPDEAIEITTLKKKYNDKFFEKYDEVPVLDTTNAQGETRILSLNQDIESVKLSDLKNMVGRELFVEEDVGIDVLIKELTDPGQWNISAGTIINSLFSILYLSVKFRKSLCVPEIKLAHNILNGLILPKRHLLEYRKTIRDVTWEGGIINPETNEGFQQLLNSIMDYGEQNEPTIFPISRWGEFEGGSYRQDVLRHLEDENSTTISYDPSWWKVMAYDLGMPRQEDNEFREDGVYGDWSGQTLVRICQLLDALTIKKLVYDKDYLDKYFKKCLKKDKRFIMIRLVLPQHANCLIYDKQLKELERYEPHGAVYYDIHSKDIDDQIRELFISGDNPIIGDDVTYFSPPDYCPIGFQELTAEHGEGDPGGFCHWWTVYYMDLRLSNPDMNRTRLLRTAEISMGSVLEIYLEEDKGDPSGEREEWAALDAEAAAERYYTVMDFNKFMRTYGAYLSIAEAYLQKVIQDNTQDPYGILMTKAMEHFIRQVL